MTRLDIFAAWAVFIVKWITALLAFVQALELEWVFDKTTAIRIIAGLMAFNVFFAPWVKQIQDFYDELEIKRKK